MGDLGNKMLTRDELEFLLAQYPRASAFQFRTLEEYGFHSVLEFQRTHFQYVKDDEGQSHPTVIVTLK